jgi:RHS repeat-associated protein
VMETQRELASGTVTVAGSQVTDEWGGPIAGGTVDSRYSWLGGKKRSVALPSGAVLMGVRVYVPQLGRFLQVDPVLGGSASAFDYCFADPVNCTDLDGRWARGKKAWSRFKRGATRAGRFVARNRHNIVRGFGYAAAGACMLASAGACAIAAGAAFAASTARNCYDTRVCRRGKARWGEFGKRLAIDYIMMAAAFGGGAAAKEFGRVGAVVLRGRSGVIGASWTRWGRYGRPRR